MILEGWGSPLVDHLNFGWKGSPHSRPSDLPTKVSAILGRSELPTKVSAILGSSELPTKVSANRGLRPESRKWSFQKGYHSGLPPLQYDGSRSPRAPNHYLRVRSSSGAHFQDCSWFFRSLGSRVACLPPSSTSKGQLGQMGYQALGCLLLPTSL